MSRKPHPTRPARLVLNPTLSPSLPAARRARVGLAKTRTAPITARTSSRTPNPQSEVRDPLSPSLPPLSQDDRQNLDLFSHLDADLVSLAKNLCIQPTQALEWSLQPHLQPWLAHLTKIRRDH